MDRESLMSFVFHFVLLSVIIGGIYLKLTLTDFQFKLLIPTIGILFFIFGVGFMSYLTFKGNSTLKGVFSFIGGVIIAVLLIFLVNLIN